MKLKTLIVAGVMTLVGVLGVVSLPGEVLAVDCPAGSIHDSADSLAECNMPEKKEGDPELISTIVMVINVIVGFVGLIAVIAVVIGGVYYATSTGDASKATKGRNAILYGIVGLVISLLAFAIVNFVLSAVF